MAVLGLRFCARVFSSCGEWGPLFIAVCGPLTIVASLVAEHRLQTRRLSNCGSRAQLLCGMWDPPRPGLEPMSPALAGRLSTTAPPGKPLDVVLLIHGHNMVAVYFSPTSQPIHVYLNGYGSPPGSNSEASILPYRGSVMYGYWGHPHQGADREEGPPLSSPPWSRWPTSLLLTLHL